MVGSPNEDTNCVAALDSGRSFLLELLDSAVVDYYYLMIRNKFYAKFCSNYLLIILNTEICTVLCTWPAEISCSSGIVNV
jgi:hypothetical protein